MFAATFMLVVPVGFTYACSDGGSRSFFNFFHFLVELNFAVGEKSKSPLLLRVEKTNVESSDFEELTVIGEIANPLSSRA